MACVLPAHSCLGKAGAALRDHGNRGKPMQNWAKSFNYGFSACIRPRTVAELQDAVGRSARIKALGTGHSFNAIADGITAVSLEGMPLAPRVESCGRKASIAGHATYAALSAFLLDNGLAVHNLASLPHISIAGAIATATHGSGDANGNLATAISGIEFLAADGSLRTAQRGDPGFEGMVVHLGALGIVTRVTLDIQPSFDIAQCVYEDLEWDRLCDSLDPIMAAGYSVSVFTTWGGKAGRIWVKRTRSGGDFPEAMFGARRAHGKQHPIFGVDPSNATDQLGQMGVWAERLAHFKSGFMPSAGDEIQSEFHVPRDMGARAIAALLAVKERFSSLVQVSEFRSVAADTLWLSPQYRQDTLSIHFTWVKDAEAVDRAVRVVEDALLPLGALPHWGKVFTPRSYARRFPMFPAFRKLRDEMDPARKFTNAWLDRVLCDDPA